jgi:hypothetical protein
MHIIVTTIFGQGGDCMCNKGEDKMSVTFDETKKINAISNIRKLARKAIEEKNLSEAEVMKSLGIKRYEKE